MMTFTSLNLKLNTILLMIKIPRLDVRALMKFKLIIFLEFMIILYFEKLTSKELVLEAASGHILVHQKPVLFFAAVSDQLHQMGVS